MFERILVCVDGRHPTSKFATATKWYELRRSCPVATGAHPDRYRWRSVKVGTFKSATQVACRTASSCRDGGQYRCWDNAQQIVQPLTGGRHRTAGALAGEGLGGWWPACSLALEG
jgi:hypothetical protein